MSSSEDFEFINANIEAPTVNRKLEFDVVLGAQFSGELYLRNTPICASIISACESEEYIHTAIRERFGSITPSKTLHLSDKSWYVIKITHGAYEWTIKRTMAELLSLHQQVSYQLQLRALLLLGRGSRIQVGSFPSRMDILFRRRMDERKKILQDYLQCLLQSEALRGTDPVIETFEISPVSFSKRLGANKWKEDKIYKIPSHTLLPMCCVLSFCKHPRWLVLKDTFLLYIRKNITTNFTKKNEEEPSLELGQEHNNNHLLGQLRRRWRLCKVFLMDQSFAFAPKVHKHRRNYLLKLYNTHGRLVIICRSENQLLDWNDALALVLRTNAARDYIDDNRYGSFAPPRPRTRITVFIDGACYMESVAKAIAQARHEIFITDWCMNPQIFLRRPISSNTWRLDKLLQTKAQQGVRICILLYSGIEGIVPFSSVKTSLELQRLHPNIHVYLSPTLIKFWSHHEKMVAIDQSIVFMGGIDLCFGRWDTCDHRLEDVYKSAYSKSEDQFPEDFEEPVNTTEIDHAAFNPYVTATAENADGVSKTVMKTATGAQRKLSERPPSLWHLPRPFSRKPPLLRDLRLPRQSTPVDSSSRMETSPKRLKHRRFTGIFARTGEALHALFRQETPARKQSLRRQSQHDDPELMYLEWGAGRRETRVYVNNAFEDDENLQLALNTMEDLEGLCDLGSHCTWIGQDYVNWNAHEPNPNLHPGQDLCERRLTPRMPWHDIACVMTGAVATDLSRHFIQRWNAIRNNRLRNSTKGTTDRERHRRKPLLLPCYPCEPWTTFHLDKVLVDPRQSSVCQAQVLRSVCDWSLGVPAGNVRKGLRQEFREWIKGSDKVTGSSTNNQDTEIGLETSILSAYIDCILDAENFVYIENQFFISFITISDEDAEKASMDQLDVPSTLNAGSHTLTHHSAFTRLPPSSHSPKVKNRIMDALFIRILRAHRQRKPFRLYIILPLVPGFVGEYGDPSARSLYRILHFTRLSLFVGSNALIPRLKTFIPNPDEYVSICGLRTYNEWPDGNMRTEIVYVHSKFMIVDDRKMIIGSANLNDRSMRGKRDSELAVLIEMDPLESRQTTHSAFIRRVRRTLMAEHLGVLPSLRRAVCNEWPIEQLNDPVTDSFFYDVWKATANKNASIFEEVFNVVPTDNLLTFEECRKNKQKIPLIVSEPDRAQQLLESVRGTLVTFPTLFLDLEDLTPPEGTMERVAPEKIWT